MAQTPSHIPLQRRKGLAMQMMVAATLEDHYGYSTATHYEYEQVLKQLSEISSQDRNLSTQRLDHFLNKSVDQIKCRCKINFNDNISTKINRRLGELNVLMANFDCSKCHADQKVCDGNRSNDDKIFSESEFCLEALRYIFNYVVRQTQQLQKEICGNVYMPTYNLATDIVDIDSEIQLPRSINVTGSYDAGINEVNITFREDKLNRTTLVQMIYVISHEIVCHGMQGILGESERENADEHCAWTEGYMDRLTYFHVEHWLTSDKTLPIWLTRSRPFSVKSCLALHNERNKKSKIAGSARTKREVASEACDKLRYAFTQRDPSEIRKLKSFFHFSHLINFRSVESKIREELIICLCILLDSNNDAEEIFNSIDQYDVIRSCYNFLRHKDISYLIKDLERISQCSPRIIP